MNRILKLTLFFQVIITIALTSSKYYVDLEHILEFDFVYDMEKTLWAEFSERDFQSVYESAHQEEVADWDRQKLIEEITNLEKRQKELVNVLAKVDPDMYAQRLQTQLQALQETNRLLRNANGLSPVGPNHLNLENIAMDQQEPDGSPPYKSPDSSTKDD
jgi:hypothetical protein